MSWWLLALAIAAPPTDLFARNCDRYLQKLGPESPLIGACYYQVGVRTGELAAAQVHLERFRADYPHVGGYLLALANTKKALHSGDGDVGPLLEQAIARFAEVDEQQGQVFALSSLTDWNLGRGDREAAVTAVGRLRQVSSTPQQDRVARSVQARVYVETGHDVGEAVRLWEELAEEPAPSTESYITRGRVLAGLARAYLMLGRSARARATALEARALFSRHGDNYSAMQAQGIAFTALVDQLDRHAGLPEEATMAEEARQLVQGARGVNPGVLATGLMAVSLFDPGGRQAALQECVAMASWEQASWRQLRCHLELARDASDVAALDRLVRHPVTRGAYDLQADIAWARLELAHTQGVDSQREAAEEALLTSLRRLDAAEPETFTRLRRRELITQMLRTAVGWRLERGETGRALALTEAVRSRPQQRLAPAAGELARVQDEITRIQRALREDAADTESLLAELTRVEREEARLAAPAGPLEQMAGDDLLQRVQARLGPEQALLVFSLDRERYLDGRPGGGSWVVAVHAAGAKAHPLGDARSLRGRIELVSGLVGGGSAPPTPLRALHRQLLDPALASLPSGVEELLVIADGALHVAPLAALLGEDGRALGQRARLVRLADLESWVSSEREGLEHALALAMVDPPSVADFRPAGMRASALSSLDTLGPLPATRREAAALTRSLGRARVEVLDGEAANEEALAERLETVDWVHLGAHAVVDPWVPERSAVLLAPSEREDGLLQVREIRSQDWQDKAVVLAACQTADGERLDGAGPLGLAQSLVDAGASAVIASLWPVSDQRSAAFFEALYAELGQGRTLAEAMHAARQQRQDDGAQAWAAFVLVGDGSLRLATPGRGGVPWWVLLAGALLVGLGMLGLWRRR